EGGEEVVADGLGPEPGDGGVVGDLRRPIQHEGQELDGEEAEPGADPEALADDGAWSVVADEEAAVGLERAAVHAAADAGDVPVLADQVRDLGAAVELD